MNIPAARIARNLKLIGHSALVRAPDREALFILEYPGHPLN
jgi:hypothetical protein